MMTVHTRILLGKANSARAPLDHMNIASIHSRHHTRRLLLCEGHAVQDLEEVAIELLFGEVGVLNSWHIRKKQRGVSKGTDVDRGFGLCTRAQTVQLEALQRVIVRWFPRTFPNLTKLASHFVQAVLARTLRVKDLYAGCPNSLQEFGSTVCSEPSEHPHMAARAPERGEASGQQQVQCAGQGQLSSCKRRPHESRRRARSIFHWS